MVYQSIQDRHADYLYVFMKVQARVRGVMIVLMLFLMVYFISKA